jgi:5-methyltetrahydrofolate--homocysteine methyltransferase
MVTLMEKIKEGKTLLSDGAWGTFLHQKGLQPGACPEAWNISHRQEIYDIARSYIEAGADMILTNSFGGSRFKLAQYGYEDRVVPFNESAARISRDAAGSDHYVLGSVGPTGVILMMGDVSKQELYEGFRDQAIALADGGVDAICIETMSALDEALVAVRAVRDHTTCPIVCTFTFEQTKQGDYRTMMGISPTEMTRRLLEEKVDVLGSNCGNGMRQMIDIVREIRSVDTMIPVLIHANAGSPQIKDGKTIFPESPREMAEVIPRVIEAGANIVGGCCGTTPEHIREIARVVGRTI